MRRALPLVVSLILGVALAPGCGIPKEQWELKLRENADLVLDTSALSVHQLRQPDLAERIAAALKRHQINPNLLTCEITESAAMEDAEGTQAIFERLAAVGVHLSIDDFGTGHSSLAYLQRLPVDELKIDRSFVREVDLSPRRYELLETIARLGHSLGLTVTAEGIEREGELDAVRRVGCDQVQGFLLGRPMDFESFLAWRDAREAAAPA